MWWPPSPSLCQLPGTPFPTSCCPRCDSAWLWGCSVSGPLQGREGGDAGIPANALGAQADTLFLQPYVQV